MRGLGHLSGFEADVKRASIRIENSCLHLQMVGMTQAMVEMVYHVESSSVEWEVAEDGDLVIDVEVHR